MLHSHQQGFRAQISIVEDVGFLILRGQLLYINLPGGGGGAEERLGHGGEHNDPP